MKAITVNGPNQISLQDVPRPEAPDKGYGIIRMEAMGINPGDKFLISGAAPKGLFPASQYNIAGVSGETAADRSCITAEGDSRLRWVGGSLLTDMMDSLPAGSTVYAYGFLGGQVPVSFHTGVLTKGITAAEALTYLARDGGKVALRIN